MSMLGLLIHLLMVGELKCILAIVGIYLLSFWRYDFGKLVGPIDGVICSDNQSSFL